MRGYLEKAGAFLTGAQNPDGGWGYSAQSGQSAPEPTCHALLALKQFSPESTEKGLSWIETRIGADGGVRYEGDDDIHWSTSLAAYCLAHWARNTAKLNACVGCLLKLKGTSDRGAGWAWTDQTFSWVEPTSYALLALKAAGQSRHPRVIQAEQMLEARTCADGGWNQGLLKAFYAQPTALGTQTALGLLALQDRVAEHPRVLQAAAFLRSEVPAHPTALTLSWAILAMDAVGEDPAGLPAELEKRQEPEGSWRGSVLLTALAVNALQATEEGRNAFKL